MVWVWSCEQKEVTGIYQCQRFFFCWGGAIWHLTFQRCFESYVRFLLDRQVEKGIPSHRSKNLEMQSICHLANSKNSVRKGSSYWKWLNGKESICQCGSHGRYRFNTWVRKIPCNREWQPTPVFLPGKSHRQRGLGGYSPWICKESDVT